MDLHGLDIQNTHQPKRFILVRAFELYVHQYSALHIRNACWCACLFFFFISVVIVPELVHVFYPFQ